MQAIESNAAPLKEHGTISQVSEGLQRAVGSGISWWHEGEHSIKLNDLVFNS